MRLSDESINHFLNKQKSMLPLVYCYSNNKRFEYVKDSINNYNGRVIKIEINVNSIKNKNRSVLIFVDDIDEKDILDVEKTLMSLMKDEAVILDITGIDSKVNKRNFVLSLLSRYNINIIKGTKEEIQFLIKGQENWRRNNVTNEDVNFRYRAFAKNNNTVLICNSEKYYVTDGFSEFYVDSYKEDLNKYCYFQNSLSAMLAVGVAISKGKAEMIQGVLISILIFVEARKLAINSYEKIENNLNINGTFEEKIFIECLVNEINNIDEEKLSYNKIRYLFRR